MLKDGCEAGTGVIRSFLMIGQSNMAGRGEFADVEPIRNDLCCMLRMGRWQPMSEPINPDRAISGILYHSGVGLAASFADEMAKHTNTKIGLIPCADGGTSLSQWMPGEILFDHAVMQAKLARRTSVLSGILWHQGEADCGSDERVNSYKERFITMITRMRQELGSDIPVVIGELSRSYAPKHNLNEDAARLNKIFCEIAEELPCCAVACSEGLTMKPDGVHFDAAACRVFGVRYFEKMLCLHSR